MMTARNARKAIRATRMLAALAERYPKKAVPVGMWTELGTEFRLEPRTVERWAKQNGYWIDSRQPTSAQKRLLDYLEAHRNGHQPTHREIGDAIGLTKKQVETLVSGLRLKGLL